MSDMRAKRLQVQSLRTGVGASHGQRFEVDQPRRVSTLAFASCGRSAPPAMYLAGDQDAVAMADPRSDGVVKVNARMVQARSAACCTVAAMFE